MITISTLGTTLRVGALALVLSGAALAVGGMHHVPHASAGAACDAYADDCFADDSGSYDDSGFYDDGSGDDGFADDGTGGGGYQIRVTPPGRTPAPARPAAEVYLNPNKSTYQVGERIQVCFRNVTQSGVLTVTNVTNGSRHTVFSTSVNAGERGCNGTWYIERGDTAIGGTLQTRAGRVTLPDTPIRVGR